MGGQSTAATLPTILAALALVVAAVALFIAARSRRWARRYQRPRDYPADRPLVGDLAGRDPIDLRPQVDRMELRMRQMEGRLEVESRAVSTLPGLLSQVRDLNLTLDEVVKSVYELEARVDRLDGSGEHVNAYPSRQHDTVSPPLPNSSPAIAHSVPGSVQPVPRMRHPVDLEGEWLVSSSSLAAVGWLLPETTTPGRAVVVLNEEIAIDHVALKKWARVFDFRGERAYVRYRTVEPALVEWDEVARRGRPLSVGVAEALS